MILAAAFAALLAAPHPAAPFPPILTDASTIVEVAPGVQYGDYAMTTPDGPLSVHVVAVDLRDPTVRIGTVLAQEHLVSQGETVASMALRTGAVAGINGDYFDINQTNQPLNVLVENGVFKRMPMHRWAVWFDAAKTPAFDEFQVQPLVQLASGTQPLKTIDDWPPPGGGAVLMTPEYGPLHPVDGVTEAALQPVFGTPPFATYRVTQIADGTLTQPAGYYLAFGPQGFSTIGVLKAGDTLSVTAASEPPLAQVQSAIGGGPLLVKNGAWYADPDGPSAGEFATHMPASAVGVTRDGTLLLVEVDGRQPALSIGVLQPQLAQLLIAFGALTGMQFDGGGSSTLVARLPGTAGPETQNSPSDGTGRRVADGLFVYSDAPLGRPARIASWPLRLRALPGASIAVRFALTDAADHLVAGPPIAASIAPSNLGSFDGSHFIAGARPGDGALHLRSGALETNVPISVTAQVARIDIVPHDPQTPQGGVLRLEARAFDSQGYPIALPRRLPWSASGGSISPEGTFRAGTQNATVRVRIGTRTEETGVTVGEHVAPIDLAGGVRFATAPAGEPGSVTLKSPCDRCTTLSYDFTGRERAAYAAVDIRLPERALGIEATVFGDGNGEVLRAAVTNAINERSLYTLARVTWRGWRTVSMRFPPELPQPITLKALYVINRVGTEAAVSAKSSIVLRDIGEIAAGADGNAPKDSRP